MKKVTKKIVAVFMALMMVVGFFNVPAVSVKADEDITTTIDLGTPTWNADKTTYQFKNADANFTKDQKIFCISVDSSAASTKGYFINSDALKTILADGASQVTGLQLTDDGEEFISDSDMKSNVSSIGTMKMTSISIVTSLTKDEILKYVREMTFYRNGAGKAEAQKVSVVTSSADLPADTAVMALNGELHFYKHFFWDAAGIDADDQNWFSAYNYAKSTKMEEFGLNGYLATITTSMESEYVANYIYYQSSEEGIQYQPQSWIGGLRTTTASFDATETPYKWDADTISQDNIGLINAGDSEAFTTYLNIYKGYKGPVRDSEEALQYYADNEVDYSKYAYLKTSDSDLIQYWVDKNTHTISKTGVVYTKPTADTYYWMDGPEAGQSFYKTNALGSNSDATKSQYTDVKYSDFAYVGTDTEEPNNGYPRYSKWMQEYALEYGWSSGGSWNDYDPENSQGVKGFIVEYSPYKLAGDDVSDTDNEIQNSANDTEIIIAADSIVSASLNQDKFNADVKISVDSVLGNASGDVELLGTDVPTYQWQKYNESTNSWEDISGAVSQSYTPTSDDIGSKIRVKVTAASDNTEGYIGTVYADASGSSSSSDNVSGTVVGSAKASISGQDFLIEKSELSTLTDAKIVTLSNAIAANVSAETVEVSVDSTGKEALKNADSSDTVEIKLTNSSDTTVSTTVKATVYDNVETVETGKNKGAAIGANDFSISLDELKSSDLLSLISGSTKANVKSLDAEGNASAGTITSESLEALKNAKSGQTVNVTFKDSVTGANVTVKAKVTGASVTAKDFLISEEDAARATADSVITKSDATSTTVAGDTESPKVASADVTVLRDADAGDQVEVTIYSPSDPDTTEVVTATVCEKVTTATTGDAIGEQIGADNFTIGVAQIKNSTDDELKELVKTLAKTVAYDKDGKAIDVDKLTLTDESLAALKAATKDTDVEVTFKTPNGTSVTVTAGVTGAVVSAHDFITTPDAAKTATSDDVVDSADATATKEDGTSDTVKADVTELNKATSGDDVSVTITADSDDKAKTTVTAYVKDEAGTVDSGENAGASIGANDFTINISDISGNVNTLKALVISDEYANVVSLDKNSDVSTDINADVSDLQKASIGDTVYVTFTDKTTGATVKVMAKVVGAQVDADNFMISKADAATATSADVIAAAGATSVSAGDVVEAPIVKEGLTELNNAESLDEVTVVIVSPSDDEAEVKVTAKVYDNVGTAGTDAVNPGEQVGANDFTISEKQCADTTDLSTLVKELANAAGLNSDGTALDATKLHVDSDSLTKLKSAKKGDTVDVVFYTDGGAKVTVKATISGTTVEAKNFIVPAATAKNANANSVKNLSDASASKPDGTSDTVNVDASSVTKLNSAAAGDTVTVTVTSASDTSAKKTVTAYVTENTGSVATGANAGAVIGGNSFKVDGRSGDMDIAGIIKAAGLVSLDKDGNVEPDSNITVSQADLDKLNAAIYDNDKTNPTVTITAKDSVTGAEVKISVQIIAHFPYIKAYDFVVTVDQISSIKTEADYMALCKLSAENADKVAVKDLSSIYEESKATAQYGTFKATTKPSVISPITFAYTDRQYDTEYTTITGYVRGTAASGEGNLATDEPGTAKKKISIGANDFDISSADAKSNGKDSANATTSTLLKKLASVVAVADSIDAKYDDIQITKNEIQPVPGKYDVTFTYGGVSITVTATVKENQVSNVDDKVTNPSADNSTVDSTPVETLSANNFDVSGPNSKGITTDEIIKLGSVKATDGNGAAVTATVVEDDSYKALNDAIKSGTKGDYPVTVKTANGTSLSMVITVKNNSSTTNASGEPTGETIAANDFEVTPDELEKIINDPSALVTKGDVSAYDTETNTPVGVTDVKVTKVDDDTYEVTYTTDKGTTTTSTIKVVSSLGDETGSNKTYDKSNKKAVTQPVTRTVKGVTINGKAITGYSVSKGTLSIPTSKVDSLNPGTYPVVITYADGKTRTFNLKVINFDSKKVVKVVPVLVLNKVIVVKNKFNLCLKGIKKTAYVTYKSSNKKVCSCSKNGIIKGKKPGKSTVSYDIVQNGSFYKVRVSVTVVKKGKGHTKNANLTKKGIMKTKGNLPEFNVYKLCKKGGNCSIKFKYIAKNAKISVTVNKKDRKYLSVGKAKKKGRVITIKAHGKKRGFARVTVMIKQNGKKYYTRMLFRIDDGTKDPKAKKYLK